MPRAQPGQRFGGRQKGTPNKINASVKQALLDTFERLGGTEHMIDWASAEPTEFYKLLGKLLPQEITGRLNGDFNINWPLPKTKLDE